MGREKTKHTKTQCDKILKYLMAHKGITQAQAVEKFGCYRLSARIFDLKEQGYDIRTIRCVKKNDEGNVVQFAKYVLEGINEEH